jgi:hypothetical protein
MKIAGIREEAAFRTKIPTERKMANTKVLPLARNIFYITNILAGSSIDRKTA